MFSKKIVSMFVFVTTVILSVVAINISSKHPDKNADDAVRAALLAFHKEHIREPLQRQRKEYPVAHVRELIDMCMGLFDRGTFSFAPVSIPGQKVDKYAEVVDSEASGTYVILLNADRLREKQSLLSPKNYEDFLILAFTHECLHIRDAGGGIMNKPDETPDEAIKRESRVWWDIAEFVLIPMREDGRASVIVDNGLEMSLRFLLACDGQRECPIWMDFMDAVHGKPGSASLEELQLAILKP